MGQSEKPNVLLLIADSLRPDPLSCYGGSVATDAFDRVANSGTVFERAYACAPGTAISHASLFSGQYPSTSGIDGQKDIPDSVPMLAEHLAAHGYETFGIPGPSRMGSTWGYDRGFDRYYETYLDEHPSYDDPLALVSNVLTHENRWLLVRDFLRALTDGFDSYTNFKLELLKHQIETTLTPPFYAMMNTTMVHQPWRAPRPYMKDATPELRRPKVGILEHVLDETLAIDRGDVRIDRLLACETTEGKARVLNDPDFLRDSELDVLWAWYTACIRYLDDQLQSFLQWFDDSGYAEDTLLILTADHGECFLEHDLWTHSYGLYDEVLHVPLLLRGPSVPAGERVSEFVSLVDVFDTVCDVAGITPPASTDGQSMFNDEGRDAVFAEYGPSEGTHLETLPDPDEETFTRLRLGRKGVRTDEFLYVFLSDGTEELYRRPSEERIPDPDPETLDQFRTRLDDALGLEFQSTASDPYEDVSGDVRANLKELGYID